MIPQNKPIVIGCDHTGVNFKNTLVDFLHEHNIAVIDCGSYDGDSVDYPDIAVAVCEKINSLECEKGILICGTGIGISISANKVNGIRAALCHDTFSARYTRLHNDANVICFGARVIGTGLALEILDLFLSCPFEGGRHTTRVEKIMQLEHSHSNPHSPHRM